MSSVKLESKIKNCGGNHGYSECPGHNIRFEYSTVVDMGSVYIDDELAFGGGDNLLIGVAELILKNERW